MNPLITVPEEILLFWLIFARIGGMILTVPILGSPNIPSPVKIGFSLFLTILILPLIPSSRVSGASLEWISYSLDLGKQLLLGVVIGYSIRLLFTGIEMAGQIIGFQMGFGFARVIDPESSAQVSVIAQFKNILAILIFLSLNAHHQFLRGLVDSFSVVPLIDFSPHPSLFLKIASSVGNIFVISLKIGAPVIVTLFITQVAIGIVARLVPQMNILMVSLPLKIGIGLVMMSFSLPYFLYFSRVLFGDLYRGIIIILQATGVG